MKNLISILLLFLLSIPIHAQIIKTAGINSGVYLSHQKWNYKKDTHDANLVGLAQSFSFTLASHEYVDLCIDIGLIQEGLFSKENFKRGAYLVPIRYNYLFLNPISHLTFLQVKRLNFNLLVGPSILYQLQVYNIYYVNEFMKSDKKWVPGINFGFGMKRNFRKVRLKIDIIANTEFIHHFNLEYAPITMSRNSIMLSFGVVFPVNQRLKLVH